ncbi:amidase [Verminephrobacter eiseniae]|nr:amidase [Verminephrobacter eiseniae]MCW5295266.1 amidase [Verminephrobacter eiseniae]MCW8185669.1 amidase [Verminephrobacter eiseniae]MCW8225186.1 amidase [Verminephrobacter eiseniae]MCW8235468.1 amidase [Verminephrobacter eiseniae]
MNAAAQKTAPALQVDGIEAGYGAMPVLRGLTLNVQHGEIVGVLGANGMGKSTLMKTLAGVLPLHAGAIRADGVLLNPLPIHARARLGLSYVQQGRGILGGLSARENLRMAWSPGLGESEDAALERVLGLFPRLQRLLERKGAALSGGEQQLLALARALVSQPWLLLLDEPTEGIQPNIISEMAHTLTQLRAQQGLTILLTEQNLDFVLDCADRILMLEKGAIVKSFGAAELKSSPALDGLMGWGAARSTRTPDISAPIEAPAAPPAQAPSQAPGRAPITATTPVHKENTMALRRPNMEQLRALTRSLHMNLSDAELAQYLEQMEASFQAYDRVDALPDFVPEVKYARTPGRRPSADENKLNAWYVKTDIRGAETGPLKGRHVVLKDNIALAGVPMMNGASTLEGYVPAFDATVAQRVLDAGGTIIGKAHCEYFCLSGGSHTNATGPVHNPWRMGTIAGGSSSGCGALVGSGEVSLAIGGDQGGSIRIPSAFSGCCGMKPTHGLVPYTGAMPIESTIDHLGPITGNVADNALLLEVLAGEDGLDPRQYSPKLAQYTDALSMGVEGLRIGILREGFGMPGETPGLGAKVRAAADQLARLGARVREVSVPMHLDGAAIWTPIALEGLQAQMMNGNGMGFNWRGLYDVGLMDRHAAWRTRADALSPSLKVSMFVGEWFIRNHGGRFNAKAQNLSRQLRATYDRSFDAVDLLLMPTLPMIARQIPKPGSPIAEIIARAFEMLANTASFDATGHPAMSLPCGLLDGLPVGVQLVGKHWDEFTIYRAAASLERAADWRTL